VQGYRYGIPGKGRIKYRHHDRLRVVYVGVCLLIGANAGAWLSYFPQSDISKISMDALYRNDNSYYTLNNYCNNVQTGKGAKISG
jgi:hypothetical protein